jgi:hypothetical protein
MPRSIALLAHTGDAIMIQFTSRRLWVTLDPTVRSAHNQ